MSEGSPVPKRFYSLDVVRGLGALAIVVNHWRSFFYYTSHDANTVDSLLPLQMLLQPLYDEGWRAVDMFFCLSGFVFFWLYSEKIRTRVVGAKEFAVLRFSRLYPLHLVTLLIVAVGELFMIRLHGSTFASDHYDVKHFILQLFLISGWRLDPSFNGPVWSVSVEMLLYCFFFLVCRFRCNRWWHVLIYAVLGEYWLIHDHGFYLITRGVVSFFFGGLSFFAYDFLRRLPPSATRLGWLGAATAVLWVLVPLEANHHYICALYDLVFPGKNFGIIDVLRRGLLRFSSGCYMLVLFPVTLCFLALWETRRGTLGRRIAILGDISYSTYLIHFPLQLIFMLAFGLLGLSATFFSSPVALLVFLSVLIPLSLCSYHCFERPLQSFLRRRLLRG